MQNNFVLLANIVALMFTQRQWLAYLETRIHRVWKSRSRCRDGRNNRSKVKSLQRHLITETGTGLPLSTPGLTRDPNDQRQSSGADIDHTGERVQPTSAATSLSEPNFSSVLFICNKIPFQEQASWEKGRELCMQKGLTLPSKQTCFQ